MKIKDQIPWKSFASKNGFVKQEELYKFLGLSADQMSKYHPGDVTFSAACIGFRAFLEDHGNCAEELGLCEYYEIETIRAQEMGAIMIAECEYLFLLLGEQAERGISTYETERCLSHRKEDLKLLSDCPKGVVGRLDWGMVLAAADAKFDTLRQLEKTEKYVECDDGPHSVEPLCTDLNMRIFLILPRKDTEKKEIRMRWTGKEIVAIHMDSLPSSILKFLPSHEGEEKGSEKNEKK
jgi:hypothetical protein